ncbi:MAG: hypothetical protein JNJ44_06560 [Zoogloeaceae bacterium]|nr:hypothetical protein [Zoogloeaceae bacterium]
MMLKRTTSVPLLGTVVAVVATQLGALTAVLGAVLGGLGYALMPRNTIQR